MPLDHTMKVKGANLPIQAIRVFGEQTADGEEVDLTLQVIGAYPLKVHFRADIDEYWELVQGLRRLLALGLIQGGRA